MTMCRWCGDVHAADRLCARAQRDLTRRSFCFLFGSGIAGALAAPSLLAATASSADIGTIDIGRNWEVVQSLYEPARATFQTNTFRPVLGRAITISYNAQRVFSGTVDEFEIMPDGSRKVRAVDFTGFRNYRHDIQYIKGFSDDAG